MNKKRQLEDMYFEGMIGRQWSRDHGAFTGMFDNEASKRYINEVETLENEIYDRTLSHLEVKVMAPFKNAVIRFNEFVNTPLYKALQEN